MPKPSSGKTTEYYTAAMAKAGLEGATTTFAAERMDILEAAAALSAQASSSSTSSVTFGAEVWLRDWQLHSLALVLAEVCLEESEEKRVMYADDLEETAAVLQAGGKETHKEMGEELKMLSFLFRFGKLGCKVRIGLIRDALQAMQMSKRMGRLSDFWRSDCGLHVSSISADYLQTSAGDELAVKNVERAIGPLQEAGLIAGKAQGDFFLIEHSARSLDSSAIRAMCDETGQRACRSSARRPGTKTTQRASPRAWVRLPKDIGETIALASMATCRDDLDKPLEHMSMNLAGAATVDEIKESGNEVCHSVFEQHKIIAQLEFCSIIESATVVAKSAELSLLSPSVGNLRKSHAQRLGTDFTQDLMSTKDVVIATQTFAIASPSSLQALCDLKSVNYPMTFTACVQEWPSSHASQIRDTFLDAAVDAYKKLNASCNHSLLRQEFAVMGVP